METIKTFYIGFDFSINKPAATILTPDNEYFFFAWPSSLAKTADSAYSSIGSDHIAVANRNLETISAENESDLTYEHTKRSYDLAKMIVSDISEFILNGYCEKSDGDVKFRVWMASEGLSFASKGNMTLNLATYKGVFLSMWYETFADVEYCKMFTYSPVTIKSTAGCAGKEARSQKDPMIKAFLKEPENEFSKVLKTNQLKNKNDKYYACVDDIVDSYWALQTMLKKQTV